MHDVKAMADGIVSTLKAFVTKAETALSSRIDALETHIKSLPTPKDGRDGVDGKDGADGKSIDPEVLIKVLDDAFTAKIPVEVERAVAALPVAKDGRDGLDGKDGIDGKSVTLDDIKSLIPEPIQGPKGEDGKSVTLDEIKALIPEPIPGRDGADGKSLSVDDIQQVIDLHVSKALLDLERRNQDVLAKAIANIPAPAPGKDGKDGLGFDDLSLEFDGERTLSLKFMRGEQTKIFEFSLPALIDKGFYRAEDTYAKGDGVTFGGSYWIAKRDNPSTKPGDGVPQDWSLAARKGRDGAKGEIGPEGRKGMDGKPGLNGRDLR